MLSYGQMLIICGTSLIMVVSAAANITVLWQLLRKKKVRRASRLDTIMIHLAIADLLVTLLRFPIQIAWTATVSWLAGDLMCGAMMFAFEFGLYLSSFVVICIAVDRYHAVLKPLNVSWEASLPRVLGGAWCGAVLASIPELILFHTMTDPLDKENVKCSSSGTLTPSQKTAYFLFNMSLVYILPLVATVYCSCAVIREIIKLSNSANDGMRRSSVGVLGRARAQTLKMTITIIAAFIICWTPYFFNRLWWSIDFVSMLQANPVVHSLLWLFSCTNSCANPIVYGIFNIRRNNRSATTKTITRSMSQSQQTIETSLESGYDQTVGQTSGQDVIRY